MNVKTWRQPILCSMGCAGEATLVVADFGAFSFFFFPVLAHSLGVACPARLMSP